MSWNRRLIPGSGPTPCPILLVGEAGGYDEHQQGRPFCGKAGMVLNCYLESVGLNRSKIHVDNVYPFWVGPGNPDPTEEQIKEGGELLRGTLKRVRPRFIGALGRFAARWFLGESFEMKRDHGLPRRIVLHGEEVIVVPTLHPAAGFYDPSAAALCQRDLESLAKVVRGEIDSWTEREMPKSRMVPYPTARSGDVTPRDGDSFDTEGRIADPWGGSWASSHGSYVFRVNRKVDGPPLLPTRLVFHYALHDLKVLRSLGVDTDRLDYDDTIVMAFLLMGGGSDSTGENRSTPLGLSLKVLSYRELGIRMKSYVDLVRPYYNKQVERWVNDLLDARPGLPEKSDPELVEVKGKWKIYTPNPPRRRIGMVLMDAITGGEPEKRWGDLPESMRGIGEEIMGESFPSITPAIQLVPESEAVQYAGGDAWATRELAGIYQNRIRERGLERVYEIDRKALHFVDEIMRNGLPLESERVRILRQELEEKKEEESEALKRIVGRRGFNPGSRDDVAQFLFRTHDLIPPRQTEGGQDSTDEKTVKILRSREKGNEEVVRFLDHLLNFRECQKYLGTYISYMEESVRGGRLYPDDISATRVVSGRLSGRLLTFPTRSDLGAKIRKCFLAGNRKRILSVDLSQIELRIMAEMSQDPVMLGAFNRKEDLHALTGRKMFRVPEVTKNQRYVAKTLNFAILYGISARALLEQLAVAGIYDYDLADCERFISEWFSLYAGVRSYLDSLYRDSEKTGEVRDWAGRIRYVPNIRLPKGPLKEKAQRDVGNFPIQAGARELVKIAEGEMIPWLRGNRDLILAILDIHDETLFEVDEDVVEEAGEIVKGFMLREGRERFGVPLEAGVSWGESWGEAK